MALSTWCLRACGNASATAPLPAPTTGTSSCTKRCAGLLGGAGIEADTDVEIGVSCLKFGKENPDVSGGREAAGRKAPVGNELRGKKTPYSDSAEDIEGGVRCQ